MKFPVPAMAAALLGLAFAGCGPAKVKGPDPDPVGQWQWSNAALGSWRLDIKDDGTFQRETTNPLDPKPVVINGRWSVVVTQRDPSWLERHGILQSPNREDEWLRSANVDPGNKAIQWSAPGTLILLYYVPKGTELAPGAVWTGDTLAASESNAAAPASDQPQIGIAERHPVRTHTDTRSDEVFLDLAGKTFQNAGTSTTAKALPDGAGTAGKETQNDAGKEAAKAAIENPDFLKVEPFVGITLELPGNWLRLDPDSAEKQRTPVAASAGRPRLPSTNSSWRFIPPGDAHDIYIYVSVQPVMFTPKQLADTSSINLDRFGAGFVKGASQALEGKGYYLRPHVSTEYTTFGERSAVVCNGEMVDPVGSQRSVRAFAIPTESATLVLMCCWDAEPGSPWKAIIERACSTFHVAETFKVPTP